MENEKSKPKTGYVSATTDAVEESLIERLTSLQGTGRATVIKMLLREYGPQKIAELEKKMNIPAAANPSSEDTKDSKEGTESQ